MHNEVRPEFVELLKVNKLTLGNWNKFCKLYKEKEITDKIFYAKVLARITDIRSRLAIKGVQVKEFEDLFSNQKIENIEAQETRYDKKKKKVGKC